MLLVRIAGQHDARPKVFTSRNQAVQSGAIGIRQSVGRCQWRADAEGREAGEFPTTEDLSSNGIIEEGCFLREARDLVNVVEG